MCIYIYINIFLFANWNSGLLVINKIQKQIKNIYILLNKPLNKNKNQMQKRIFFSSIKNDANSQSTTN